MALTDVLLDIVSPILTVIAGGGWFVTYKAYKRGANGEATQKEADGWKSMQDVYQQTIEDLKQSCEYIRNDRDLLRQENEKLRLENNMLRDKILELEKQIAELRRDIARQGRRIESLNIEQRKKKKEEGNETVA